MSVAKLSSDGENRLLDILFGALPVDGVLYVGLYRNQTELAKGATLVDISEVSGYGYSRKSITRGHWTVSGNEATYPELTFMALGGEWGDIYGYFVCTSLTGISGKLLFSEHLDAPLNVASGKGVKITLRLAWL